MVVRTLSVACVHRMDAEAEKVNFRGVEMWHIIAICLQGLRAIAILAACLLAILLKQYRTSYSRSNKSCCDG